MFVTWTRLRWKSVPAKEIYWKLPQATSHKLLGVYLSYNEHVKHLCKKPAKHTGVLTSIRHFRYLPFNECILFYNATIQPLFLYDRAVWSMTSKTNIRPVLPLQKRAATTILDVKTKEEWTVSLFKKLNWMPFMVKLTLTNYSLSLNAYRGNAQSIYAIT